MWGTPRGARAAREMSTADLAGPAPQLHPEVEPSWRGVCARASVALGALGLLAVALVVVVTVTFWLDGLPGAGTLEDVAVLTALIASVAGLVTGFLGRTVAPAAHCGARLGAVRAGDRGVLDGGDPDAS